MNRVTKDKARQNRGQLRMLWVNGVASILWIAVRLLSFTQAIILGLKSKMSIWLERDDKRDEHLYLTSSLIAEGRLKGRSNE